ncbi:hypothetical protein E5D57_007862 [Metarhizium anisopliae]|nr:hypothetical protein E5D57_007862 [Metarhizium anisopliae]
MSVALASSEFAIDQLCAKLGALCPSKESDMESAAMFKRSLEDLHTSYLATEVSKPIRHMKFEDAIGILMNSTDTTIIATHTEFFQRFPVVYEAKMECERPAFDLFQIDADKVSRIGSDYNLTVADLVKPETLLETVASDQKMGTFLRDAAQLMGSAAFGTQAEPLEALSLAEAA